MTIANRSTAVHGNAHPDPTAVEEPTFLGARLRGLREQHGLSLRDLAAKVGVTATALHSWERGRRNPKAKHLQAFADTFRLTRSELLCGYDDDARGSVVAIGDRRRNGSNPDERARLAEVIAACKERIAGAAGIPVDGVRIVIEA